MAVITVFGQLRVIFGIFFCYFELDSQLALNKNLAGNTGKYCIQDI
jgi:hypothetical protein